MRKLLLLIALPLFMISCEDEVENILGVENIELSSFIIENYSNDAKQLYFHEVFQDSDHPNYNDPMLDENEVYEILKILQAVYNLDSPESDLVFEEYQIHGYYCYGLNTINLKVDTRSEEIINLVEGITPTRNPNLDNLLNIYSFDSVRTSYSYPRFPWLTIYTKNEFNMIPIEQELMNVESVEVAEFNKGCIGDGSTIELIRSETFVTVTFSIGSGGCPAGCINREHWEFKVSNGIAEFIRTY